MRPLCFLGGAAPGSVLSVSEDPASHELEFVASDWSPAPNAPVNVRLGPLAVWELHRVLGRWLEDLPRAEAGS